MIVEVALITMTAIQCLEFLWLYRSSKRTNEILENPAPVLEGLFDALKSDKQFAEEFGQFIAWSGAAALAGVKKNMGEAGVKMPKIRSFGDLIGALVSLPNIQAAIEKKAENIVSGAVKDKAAEVAVGWGAAGL